MAEPTQRISITVAPMNPCTLATPRWWGGEIRRGTNLVIAGGNMVDVNAANHGKPTTSIEVLDLLSCKHRVLATQLQNAHSGSQPQLLRNGQAIFFSGMDTDLVEIVDRSNRVRPGGKLFTQRSAAAAVELSDGRVLIAGGYHNAEGKATPVAVAEIYNPKTKTSTAIANMTLPRASHSITPIGNGRYLLVGGAKAAARTAEIFDEQTGQFSAVNSAPGVGRKDHRAVADAHGRVWVLGGTNSDGQSQEVVEYYDIASSKFFPISHELVEGREDLAVLYIPELDVIMSVGGEKKGTFDGRKDPFVKYIEVFDIKNNVIQTSQLTSERDEPTLQLLSVNPRTKTAEVLVLQGVTEDTDGQKRVPSPEKITIRLN